MAFTPAVTLDLTLATPKTFEQAMEEFAAHFKVAPRAPLSLTDGWLTVDQQLSEQLLLRNPPGANRKAKLASVRHYAEQMVANDWQKTGQALILTDQGILIDGQHRLWASYFSGKTFVTYVITGVPHFDGIFAYIDSGRSRTATDALMTGGKNGQASVMSQAIQINHLYENGCLRTMRTAKTIQKLSHMGILRVSQAHPELEEAAHAVASEYKEALEIVKVKPVAVFLAWKILQSHNTDLLDEFMSALVDSGIPMFGSVRKAFADDENSAQPMNKYGRLAYLIKLFNAWYSKQNIKRIGVRIDEDFPQFLDHQVQDEAA